MSFLPRNLYRYLRQLLLWRLNQKFSRSHPALIVDIDDPSWTLSIECGVEAAGDRDVNSFYNNLAEIYRLQGKYKEAEHIYKKVLRFEIKLYGRNDLNVAIIYNNLALSYYEQERYIKAIPLYKKT